MFFKCRFGVESVHTSSVWGGSLVMYTKELGVDSPGVSARVSLGHTLGVILVYIPWVTDRRRNIEEWKMKN